MDKFYNHLRNYGSIEDAITQTKLAISVGHVHKGRRSQLL